MGIASMCNYYDVQFFNQGNMYAITVFSKFTIIEAVHNANI